MLTINVDFLLTKNWLRVLLRSQNGSNSRNNIEQMGRSRRLAATLASIQNQRSLRLPLKFFDRQRSTNVARLPRIEALTDLVDDVSAVTSSYRDVTAGSDGGGYTRQLERAPSDENNSRQLDTGYARRFSRQSDDDGVSSVSPSQLHPARFGGIQRRYRYKFGRSPSTLLSYREDDAVPTSRVEDDDVQASAGRGGGSGDGYARYLRSHDSDGGYSRYLSPPDVDDASSVNSSPPRPGAFGGISQKYRNVFGVGPGTLLTGGHGFLTSSVAADDVETGVRGDGGKKAAASRHSDRGGSMLRRLMSWRRRRDSGW